MGNIDAVMQYDDDGLPWSYRMETIRKLAGCHGVGIRVEQKTPERDRGYYSITVSADEMRSIKRFITSLFTYIGMADSPVFFVYAKNGREIPVFSKRLVPVVSGAEVEC